VIPRGGATSWGTPRPPSTARLGRCRPTSKFVFLRTDLVAVEPMPRDHFRIASSLFAGTLNSAAPFSMAAASSAASTVPSQTLAKL
jgi:hypothetical protein